MTAISIYMFTFKPKLKRLDGVYTSRWQRNVLPQHQQRSLLTQCLWQRSIHDVHEYEAKEVTFLPRLVVVGSAWLHRYRCAAWTWQMKSKKNIHGENCNWTDWFFNVSPHKCFTMLESYWSESNPASMACSNHTQHVPTEIVYISYLLWYLISVCKSVCTHSGKDLCSNKYIYIHIATNLAQLWYDALRCPESAATDAQCGARSESPEWRQGHPSNNHATIVIEYY